MKSKKIRKRSLKITNEQLLNYRNLGDLSDDSCTNDLYKKRFFN